MALSYANPRPPLPPTETKQNSTSSILSLLALSFYQQRNKEENPKQKE